MKRNGWLALLSMAVLSGCGGGGGSSGGSAPGPKMQDRIAAATTTAQGSSACLAVQPFYWEIGDRDGRVAGSASPSSDTTYSRTTTMLIASASKWWFGAYVAELRGGRFDDADLLALRMLSGYHSLTYTSCLRLRAPEQAAETVAECLHSGANDTFTAEDVGRFYYDSGHFQKHAAIDLELGDDNSAQLASDISAVVGTGPEFEYDSPQLAAGGLSSAARYAVFLQKLMRGELRLGTLLGSHAVCTHVGDDCPSAVYTPIPSREAWHYSIAHWVEDDPAVGDGAFSSPGAFGFYPWISADRRNYGILARYSVNVGADVDSYTCGRLIRKAFQTAEPQ